MTIEELATLARHLRETNQDTQEAAAAKLGIEQPQVSCAEKGERRYLQTCISLVELYSDFKVQHPLFRLQKKESTSK